MAVPLPQGIKVFYGPEGKTVPYYGSYSDFAKSVEAAFELTEDKDRRGSIIFKDETGAEIEPEVFNNFISKGMFPVVHADVEIIEEQPSDELQILPEQRALSKTSELQNPPNILSKLKILCILSAIGGFLVLMFSILYLLIGIEILSADLYHPNGCYGISKAINKRPAYFCSKRVVEFRNNYLHQRQHHRPSSNKPVAAQTNVWHRQNRNSTVSPTNSSSKPNKRKESWFVLLFGFSFPMSWNKFAHRSSTLNQVYNDISCDCLTMELCAALLGIIFGFLQIVISAVFYKNVEERWIVGYMIGTHVLLGVVWITASILVINVITIWQCNLESWSREYYPLHASFITYPEFSFSRMSHLDYCNYVKTATTKIHVVIIMYVCCSVGDAVLSLGICVVIFVTLLRAQNSQKMRPSILSNKSKKNSADQDVVEDTDVPPDTRAYAASPETSRLSFRLTFASGILFELFSMGYTFLFMVYGYVCLRRAPCDSSRGDHRCAFLNRLFGACLFGNVLGVGQIFFAFKIKCNVERTVLIKYLLLYNAFVFILSTAMLYLMASGMQLHKCFFDDEGNIVHVTNYCKQVQAQQTKDAGTQVGSLAFFIFLFFYLTFYVNLVLSFISVFYSLAIFTFFAIRMICPNK